jgi:sugar lactone lactonase YvrE
MITPLVNSHRQLAENPLWQAETGMLYWTDIDAGEVHRFHLETGRHEIVYHGPAVGGFTFQENGDLLLFRVNDLALLHPDGTLAVLREFADEGMTRFNDVIADPEGRVYAGTIGRTETSGGLFRVDRDLHITLLFRGTGVSNGMGFSPDLRTLYWTCSTRRQIRAYDYESATGSLSNERVIYQASKEEGIPDGLTIDGNGHLWSARWDGFAVIHHAPDGKVLERHEFPVAKVTSLTFGGPRLDQFFVTTAGGAPDLDTEDGAIYQWSAGVSGPEEFRSRVGV